MNTIDTSFSGLAVGAAYVPTPPETLAQNRELIQAVKAINASEMIGDKNMLTFAVDRETRRPVMRIVNRETHELVRQLPPEEVLRMAAELKALEK
jgi:uncharacterized FlaG/YvyC family protein